MQNAPGSLSRSSDVVSGISSRNFDINPFNYALNTSRALRAYDSNGEREYYTLNFAPFNILEELDKPGRDPRQTIKVFEFDASVKTIDDLKEGMLLPGIVTNITNFGCFVDIGIKENGLVHISQLADRYVSDPTEIVSIHQQIMVKVMSVDKERKRVQLSMKDI